MFASYNLSLRVFSDVVMLFFKHAVSILVVWVQTMYGRPALLSNITDADYSVSTEVLGTTIPTQFTIDRRMALPLRFPPEAGYINIIAALYDVSSNKFKSKMHPTYYRTTRFESPVIKIETHGDLDVPRRYVVWGLFLMAFYLRANQRFSFAFFILKWEGKEVAGIGIGDRIAGRTKKTFMGASSLSISSLKANRQLLIRYEYTAGAPKFEQGAAYLTIIGALTTAAPSAITARITETWISFLNDEPCVFIVVPSLAVRTAPPYLLYEDLKLILAKTADFLVEHARYSPLTMNVSVDGVEVAKAALTNKFDGHGSALGAIARTREM